MNALLSIKPKYVEKILDGKKIYEYRRIIFKEKIEKVIIYSTKPIGKIVGEFEVDNILSSSPATLWRNTKNSSGITKEYFNKYFNGKKTAFAIKIKNPKEYDIPKDLKTIIPNGIPPQSFCYVR